MSTTRRAAQGKHCTTPQKTRSEERFPSTLVARPGSPMGSTSGLAGLVPARPGPRRAHKLTEVVVAFAQGLLVDDPSLSSSDLATAIGDRFGITVHPRSVERALARAEEAKKGGFG